MKLLVNGRVVYLPNLLCADCGEPLRKYGVTRCHQCANRARHPEPESRQCVRCDGTRTSGSRSGLCWSCWAESRRGTNGHVAGPGHPWRLWDAQEQTS